MRERKVAYLFVYRNGIREQSVGVVRQYRNGEATEVVMELLREKERSREWKIYYFNSRDRIKEAAYIWDVNCRGTKSELSAGVYRLCTEAGNGKGVLLLPRTIADKCGKDPDGPETDYYLCGRFDEAIILPEQVQKAFKRGQEEEGTAECMESAKRLVEEITKAAEGSKGEGETEKQYSRKREFDYRVPCLEELLTGRPSYMPCREPSLLHSVRILPEELALLPKDRKMLAQNSFLLHSFYHYKHLLLGRRREKEQDDYVLLVPGVYEKRNACLAELFGFSEFFCVEQGTGKFGYWCGKI